MNLDLIFSDYILNSSPMTQDNIDKLSLINSLKFVVGDIPIYYIIEKPFEGITDNQDSIPSFPNQINNHVVFNSLRCAYEDLLEYELVDDENDILNTNSKIPKFRNKKINL